jgi:hypothetical protein
MFRTFKNIGFNLVLAKKIKLFFWLSIISFFLFIQPINTHGQQKISFGLKSGITFSKVGSIDAFYYNFQIKGYPKNSYKPGYFIGLFGKYELNKEISLVSELYILRYISQITITTSIETILDKHFKANYIRLPFLIRYQTDWVIKPYVNVGIDLGYLIIAEHQEYDLFYNTFNGSFDITNELPRMDLSFNIGLGIERKLFEQKLILQVNFLIGITKYTSSGSENLPYEPEFLFSWRNNSLLIGLGSYF